MLSLLSRLTGGDRNACLKICLQNDFLFLRGTRSEAGEQPLNGVISLQLPAGQHANGVRLRMVGFLRCRDHDISSSSPSSFRTVRVFEHEWAPFIIDHSLKVDSAQSPNIETHEWPFEFMIPGDTPETFRGCSCCSVTYQLTGTTIRGKSSTATPQAYQPIRISRTLQNSEFELMDPTTMEGTWGDRISYCISIGHRAVALGTAIPLEMRLTPLDKKSKISKVRCELLESHKFDYGGPRPLTSFSGERQVAEWFATVESQEDSARQEYRITQKLPLPNEPKRCSPDVDMDNLSTNHVLHVEVDVAEPGDDLFRARYHATIPIVLFISPKIPIDASENFVRPKSPTGECLPMLFGGLDVPPLYGEHKCDKILEQTSWETPV
ncbi:CreD [Colletotrichum truncatum]|uniref:CreD n=1 Tax=Colletotrichum truncatum TaxID=5467 RepID=A0ACC3Z6Y9_COLTU|nr:CreD [Colletotrichum truncatum]KAF6785229.1 CreD [Colletotrichum truncatum]